MKKILPIQIPPILGYLYHAYPLSVLSNWDAYLPWFYSHYIQLHCPKDFQTAERKKGAKFDFYHPRSHLYSPQGYQFATSPWLDSQLLDREVVIGNHRSIVEFVVDCIRRDYYVQVCVDEFFIPNTMVYQEDHFVHEVLVFGFDKQEKIFYTSGFDRNGNYGNSQVTFSELEQGYLHSSIEKHYDEYGVILYKNKKGAQYNFDYQYVLEQLEDYVYSKNTSERFRALANPVDNVFGLNTYRCLNDHFEYVLKKVKRFDIRPLHIFWEHKKCMVSRIEYLEHLNYLNPQNEFSKSYKVIEERTDRQRIMMLKFLITDQNPIVEATIKEIDRIAQAEHSLLESMLDQLQ